MIPFVFINFSNHPSSFWNSEQVKAAEKIGGRIIDVPFPAVSPYDSTEQVANTAKEYADRIISYRPATVMCQGEFTFSYAVIQHLRKAGIKVVAACSERITTEEHTGGDDIKYAVFRFIGFRDYPDI